jgi:hypothetical protein
VAERSRAQAVPIKTGAFRSQAEFAGQLDEMRSRQRVALDQVAAADRADLRIDLLLRIETASTAGGSAAGVPVAMTMAMRSPR